ncbi:MAG: hypothetical protein AAGH15_08755 [Myxococcota bacterium]
MDPRLQPVFGFLAFAVGCAFAYSAGSVALSGTGVSAPEGAGVVAGRIVGGEGPALESPVGAPFLYGLVRLGGAGGGGGIDQSWSQLVGTAAVTVETEGGERVDVTLPRPDLWRGAARFEDGSFEELGGLAVVSDATDVDQRLRPPYRIRVKALRVGDAVVYRPGDEGGELWVGDPATIARDLQAREEGRWPVVGLMGVMALVSFVLAFRTLGAVRRSA